jgi:hypothetical protein
MKTEDEEMDRLKSIAEDGPVEEGHEGSWVFRAYGDG